MNQCKELIVNGIYCYKGKSYRLLHIGKMKVFPADLWIGCVTYQSFETGDVFTRNTTDFKNKFNLME